MSIIVTASISKRILSQINKYIPASRRSKLISQFILDNLYSLPTTKKAIEDLLAWDSEEEMVIQPIFLSEEAATQIDSLLENLQKKVDEYHLYNTTLNRSMLIRDITRVFAEYVKENPVEKVDSQFIIVNVPKGTMERLSQHIDKMERSSTINHFILEEYKPKSDVKTLKEALPQERERLALYIDEPTLDRINEIIESYGPTVKKTHIIRDAVYRLIEILETDKPKKKELEKTLYRTIEEIAKHAKPEEIRELLKKYSPKEDSE